MLQFLTEGAKVVVADLNEKKGAKTLELARQAGYVTRFDSDVVTLHRRKMLSR